MGNRLHRVISYFRIEHALLLIPIGGFAVFDSASSAFSSILGILQESYPDVPVTTIQLILTIPPLISVPGTLLAGLLSTVIRKKYIAEFALLVIFIGGMVPLASPNPTITTMFLASGSIGLGQGLLHPLASAFICQSWDGATRGRVLGFKQSFNYVGAALVALGVGTLALVHWSYAFLVYIGVVPILILTHFLLPKGTKEKRSFSTKHVAGAIRDILNPSAIYLFVLFFVATMFSYGFHTNVALLVSDRDLGSTMDVSFVTSTISITSFLLGVAYGATINRLGKSTLAIGFVLLACGMVVSSLATNIFMLVMGGVLFGLGTGIQEISTVYYVSMVVEKRYVTMALSIVVSCVSLGAAISPFTVQAIQLATFGAQSASTAMLVCGFGFAALAVIEGVRSNLYRLRRSKAEAKEDEDNDTSAATDRPIDSNRKSISVTATPDENSTAAATPIVSSDLHTRLR